MRVATEKLPGVTSAAVSLEKGLVVVQLTSDNQLTVSELRKAIRNQGFSPRGADIEVSGRLAEASGVLVLEVPGSGVRYSLRADGTFLERLRPSIGGRVSLEGRIGHDDHERTPMVLEVLSLLPS